MLFIIPKMMPPIIPGRNGNNITANVNPKTITHSCGSSFLPLPDELDLLELLELLDDLYELELLELLELWELELCELLCDPALLCDELNPALAYVGYSSVTLKKHSIAITNEIIAAHILSIFRVFSNFLFINISYTSKKVITQSYVSKSKTVLQYGQTPE